MAGQGMAGGVPSRPSVAGEGMDERSFVFIIGASMVRQQIESRNPAASRSSGFDYSSTLHTPVMSHPPLEILFEDNHLLVIAKPAGLPTMGVADDRATALTLAKDYIRKKYNKPGNVYLGIVSRLDAPTTGALLIARTSKAAKRLSEQFREGQVTKQYWALVEGTPPAGPTELQDWMRKDERHRRMHISNASSPGAQEARLVYRRLAEFEDASLVEVELLTGRKHQIRVQLANQDYPILGDRKYGSTVAFGKGSSGDRIGAADRGGAGNRRGGKVSSTGIALHSRRLVFEHPVRKEPIEVVAALPATWRKFGVREPPQG